MSTLPTRLERPPLVEAIIEVRFSGGDRFVGELLPGVIHEKLKSRYTGHAATPVAQIPRELRERDPELKYHPLYRLDGVNEALLLGDHVVASSKLPPYSGWGSFRDATAPIFRAIHSSDLVSGVERFSLKVLNIVPLGDRHPTEVINGSITLDSLRLRSDGLKLRAEIEDSGFTNVVEITSSATARWADSSKTGLLISVDSIKSTAETDFWANSEQLLDDAHAVLKKIFFAIIHPKLIDEFGPIRE